MKLESILLKTFFAAAVLTCLLTLGAMVTTSAPYATAPVNIASAR